MIESGIMAYEPKPDGLNSDGANIATYAQFWPFYLRQHAKPATRGWHFFGVILVVASLLAAFFTSNPWYLLGTLFGGYGPAWIAHFWIEKNRPATFRYPFWSLISDFRMTWAWLCGGLPAELKKAGV